MDLDSISCGGKNILKKCDKIYLEGYTVNFPYSYNDLERFLEIDFEILDRNIVEDEDFLKDAKNKNIALLVYGDALSATTHTQLILACKKGNIDYKIFHNSSIFITIAQSGLQLYKFGKTASMPLWTKSYEPTSFLDYYLENKKIGAHTLLLIDIGMDIYDAVKQLEIACNEKGCEVGKIIVISNAGLRQQKIFYDNLSKIKEIEIEKPYCLILPAEMHFLEQDFLEKIREDI